MPQICVKTKLDRDILYFSPSNPPIINTVKSTALSRLNFHNILITKIYFWTGEASRVSTMANQGLSRA